MCRWKCPHMERPIKVHLFFPFLYLVLTAVITLLPMIAKPVETAIGFVIFPPDVLIIILAPYSHPQSHAYPKQETVFLN